jgi:predicted nucleic acid-binding protein
MKCYLADTSVLSELLKKRPHPGVLARLDRLPPARLFASEISRLELRFAASLVPDGKRLWRRIEDSVLPRATWVGIDESCSLATAELLARMQKAGTPIGPWDTCLAGTALALHLTLATRNAPHFNLVPGLRVEDWFAD